MYDLRHVPINSFWIQFESPTSAAEYKGQNLFEKFYLSVN